MNQQYLMNVKDDFTIMKQEPFGPLVTNAWSNFKSFDEVLEEQTIM